MQLIEFESTAMMLGHLGVRMSLISYPLVSVKKVRSTGIHHMHTILADLRCAPNTE